MSEPKTTSIFRMPNRALVSTLFFRYGLPWAAGGGVAAIILVIISIVFADVRYAILALMTVLILLPMAMAFLYFNYALHPDVAFNTLPHTISVEGERMNVIIYPELKERKEKKKYKWGSGGKKSGDFDSDAQETDPEAPGFQTGASAEPGREDSYVDMSERVLKRIPLCRIGCYRVGLQSVTVDILPDKEAGGGAARHSRRASGLIYLPLSAFSSPEAMNEFLKSMTSGAKAPARGK